MSTKVSYRQELISHFKHSKQFYYIITDSKGQLLYANPLFGIRTGYTSGQTPSLSIEDFMDKEDAQKCFSAIEKCRDHAGTFMTGPVRIHIQGSSSTICWELSLSTDPVNKAGNIQWIGSEQQDKTATDAFQNGAFYRNIIADLLDATLLTDDKGVVTYASHPVRKILGYEPEELLDKSAFDFLHPDDREHSMDSFFSEVAGSPKEKFVYSRVKQKSGEWLWCMIRGHNLLSNPYVGAVLINLFDDTLRRSMELALIESEKRLLRSESFYRNMIAHSLDGIVMTDAHAKITYCGPSVTKISGYETEQILGHSLFEYVHPEDLETAKEAFVLEVSGQTRRYYILIRIRHSDGSWRWCSVRGHNLLDTPGINSMIIYFTEESHRKEIEDRLRESDQRFRHLIQNLNLGIILMNEKGIVLLCNKFAVDVIGLTEKEFIGMPILGVDWDAIHEDGSKFLPDDYPIAVAVRTRKSVRDVVMGVHQIGNPERVWVLINAEVVLDDNDHILYAICSYTEITEQRRLSRQLIEQEIQKQKLLVQATIDGQEKERKEIGRELHDNINQHLTTTRLYLEIAKEKTGAELLQMIDLAHKGLLHTVSEIRQLSQSLMPPSLSDIGLVESIQDLCVPLEHTHAFSVDFEHYQFDEALLPENMKLMLFRIIQEQINNIIRHAEANSVQICLQIKKDHVILSVTDNGKGFNPKSIKKGLGFDNISNRAGLFGGTLRIDTAPGNGCTIEVKIPLQ